MESLAPEGHLAHRWVLDKGEVALLAVFGDDKMIADTARVSYRKGTKQTSTDRQLIRYLMRNRHTGPFEHVGVRLYLKAPLFVLQQLLRHRTFRFNQVSGRYSEMLSEAYVPLPEHVTTQDNKNKQARTSTQVDTPGEIVGRIETSHEEAFGDYRWFLENGVARELARVNLPHGTYSEIIVTADLHNLLHFLSLRLNPHAQYEIRVAAEAIHDFIKGVFPAAVEAWEDCELNSFKLTGQMQEAMLVFIKNLTDYEGAYSAAEADCNWQCALNDALKSVLWISTSEKDQFVHWCVTKLKPRYEE